MGSKPSRSKGVREFFSNEEDKEPFRTIGDKFETPEEVIQALRMAGVESCQLIVGVDFTKSNEWSGRTTFDGRCLHSLDDPPNPYMIVLSLIARTLQDFDSDNKIPCYGFGDAASKGDAVFSFKHGHAPAIGFQDLLDSYRNIVPHISLAGPTSFGPIIRQAMRDVYNSGMEFTLLLIIADGQIASTCMQDTSSAIVDAASFPISIVMIGVGDGPWDTMNSFDDSLPQRKWDNFQFVEYNKHFKDPRLTETQKEGSFVTFALMEISEQYKIAGLMTGNDSKQKVDHIIRSIPSSILIDSPSTLELPLI